MFCLKVFKSKEERFPGVTVDLYAGECRAGGLQQPRDWARFQVLEPLRDEATGHRWLTSVILATQEAEIRKIAV
jgi:hypothetical protein